MKKNKAILILLILSLATAGIVSIAYLSYTIEDVKRVDISFKVGDRLGINLDTDKIWMGMVAPGNSASREIILSNNNTFPVIVRLKITGELKEYVTLAENNFIITPATSKAVAVSATAPKDMDFGNYTGTLVAVFEKQR